MYFEIFELLDFSILFQIFYMRLEGNMNFQIFEL